MTSLHDVADAIEERAQRIGADELLKKSDVRKVVVGAEQKTLRCCSRQRRARLDRDASDGSGGEDRDVDGDEISGHYDVMLAIGSGEPL